MKSSKKLMVVLAAGALLAGAGLANATTYTFTDLGTLGGASSYAYGINNAGQIVGQADLTGNSSYHATLWSNGATYDLGTLGGKDSVANAINSSGQVVGWSNTSSNATHATSWGAGAPADLGTLGGTISNAAAINDAGQVVGWAANAGNARQLATTWSNSGAITTLSDLGGQQSGAYGINNAGVIVGFSEQGGTVTISHTNLAHSMVWNGSSAIDISASTSINVSGSSSLYGTSYGINNNGTIVGAWGAVSGYCSAGACWYQQVTPSPVQYKPDLNGKYLVRSELSTYGLYGVGAAYGINSNGKAVGFGTTLGGVKHAVVWDPNSSIGTDLNSFLDASAISAGWVLTSANAINDSGSIVGEATNAITGARNAFLLAAVPEPESYALLLAGLGLIGATVRRRQN